MTAPDARPLPPPPLPPAVRIVAPTPPNAADAPTPPAYRIYDAGRPGGPSAVVKVVRQPSGAWRVSYGLGYLDAAGDVVGNIRARAIEVPTLAAATAAAEFARALLADALRAHLEHIGADVAAAAQHLADAAPLPAWIVADDAANAADDDDGSRRVVPFVRRPRRSPRPPLAPTG